MTFYKLHLGGLQICNIKLIKQNGTITACKIIYHTYSLKQVNCWTASLICINQGHIMVFLIPVKVPSLILCFITTFIYFRAPTNKIFQRHLQFKSSNLKILFDYFSPKGENDQLSNKSLSQKLLILFLLLESQRINTGYFFTVDRMTVRCIGVTFSHNHVLKHSKLGKKLDSFHYRAYHNKKLCCRDLLNNT